MYHIKFLILTIITFSTLSANPFENDCKECHFQDRQLQMFMSKYTLKYSSEKRIKKAILEYLKNPNPSNSVMPMGFLNRWGTKPNSSLNDKELNEAINLYYERFNLQRVIK